MVSIVQLKAFHALYFLWNLLLKNHVSMLDPVRKGGFQAEDVGVLATFGLRLGCLNILTIFGSLLTFAPLA